MRKYPICSAILILILALHLGHSAVHYVHPDSVLNGIQAGLDLCSPHDTVLVAPGTYQENISWPFTQGIDLISEYGPDSRSRTAQRPGRVVAFVRSNQMW